MVGWHHQGNGHEFEQDGEGQGLACSSPWGRKESDMTEPLNNNNRHVRELLADTVNNRHFFHANSWTHRVSRMLMF